MIHSRRRLPHVWSEGVRLFVTWHLYGSLPHALYPPPNKQNAGRAFVWMDRYLDSARVGPLYLKQPPIAQLVVDSIRYNAEHLQSYDLEAFVVMANHVHLPSAAARKPQPIPANSKRIHRTRSQSLARTHRPALLAGGILRSFGARRSGIDPHQGVH